MSAYCCNHELRCWGTVGQKCHENAHGYDMLSPRGKLAHANNMGITNAKQQQPCCLQGVQTCCGFPWPFHENITTPETLSSHVWRNQVLIYWFNSGPGMARDFSASHAESWHFIMKKSSAPSNNKQTTLLFLKQVSEKRMTYDRKTLLQNHGRKKLKIFCNLDHSVAVWKNVSRMPLQRLAARQINGRFSPPKFICHNGHSAGEVSLGVLVMQWIAAVGARNKGRVAHTPFDGATVSLSLVMLFTAPTPFIILWSGQAICPSVLLSFCSNWSNPAKDAMGMQMLLLYTWLVIKELVRSRFFDAHPRQLEEPLFLLVSVFHVASCEVQ